MIEKPAEIRKLGLGNFAENSQLASVVVGETWDGD